MAVSASQVTFSVFLKSLFSRSGLASTPTTLPLWSLFTFLMVRLPQLMKVALVPSTNCSASTPSISTLPDLQTVFCPTEGSFGWRSALDSSSAWPSTETTTL